MKFILPSEAQQIIYHFGLKDKYFITDFKKYSPKDFGVNKLSNMVRFDLVFQEKLFKRPMLKYSRGDALVRYIFSLRNSRFVFYDEDEVMEWIYINRN